MGIIGILAYPKRVSGKTTTSTNSAGVLMHKLYFQWCKFVRVHKILSLKCESGV